MYDLSYVYTPGGDTVFEGKAAKSATLESTFKKNGVNLTQGANRETRYFQIGPFASLGSTLGSGEYIVRENQLSLPATGKVGDWSFMNIATSYTDSSKATVYATSGATWEVQADTATTAYICAKFLAKFSNGGSIQESMECYKTDASGAILGNKVTAVIGTKTVSFVSK